MIRFSLISLLILCSSCDRNIPIPKTNEIRLSIDVEPTTLDPRQARDLNSLNILSLLFEGLMRQTVDGELILAGADFYEISEEGRKYTFHLKNSHWSNGDEVTAQDFVHSWTTSLSRQVPSPYAYQLYAIKGAKEGNPNITILDPHTFTIELNEPEPTFLEILSLPISYPVHKTGAHVNNGPYTLASFKQQSGLSLIKNVHYRDKEQFSLDKIELVSAKEGTAVALFEENELDWVGSPLGTLPLDMIDPYIKSKQIHFAKGASTHLLRVNVEAIEESVRRALYHAIDRDAIVNNLRKGAGAVAISYVPSCCWKEVHTVKTPLKGEISLPLTITLSYPNTDLSHRLAQVLQQQWKENLNIEVRLNRMEPKSLSSALQTGSYEIALGSWYADFLDPINFLEVFKTKECGTNQTCWENSAYISLLDQSQNADPQKREALLKEAENILMDELPIIPIYHSSYIYLKKDYVKDIEITPLGRLEIKRQI